MKLVAKTAYGLEDLLVEEIKAIGGEHVTKLNRAVSFKGSNKLIYKANYMLRTALRIIKPILEFEARHEERFYKEMQKYDWSYHLGPNDTLAIDATVQGDYFTHSKYIALKAKDAIVDQLRDKFGSRPNIDLDDPDFRLNIHISNKTVTVSIDTSGFSLHKRGYKKGMFLAPISEVLAAGMLKLSDWTEDKPLVDLMCGSGTILMEAAMLAQNIPAGFFIEKFGFMNWGHFDEDLWKEVKQEADADITLKELEIHGNEISKRTYNDTRRMLDSYSFSKGIQLSNLDFKDLEAPFENGVVITNPPYGERFDEEDPSDMYREMGNHLKQNFQGYNAWVITSNLEAMKSFGLRPSRKIMLYNGNLKCKFHKFELYGGSKKAKYMQQ